MKLLFLFLDGIGLGSSNPEINPFASVDLPNLQGLLGGKKLLLDSLEMEAGRSSLETDRATLVALDAGLGVDGLPQSATGQAVLLTGINVPAEIGYHYGPKPNKEVAGYLRNGNIFTSLSSLGLKAGLINAYPQGYFDSIQSGRRLYSAIPLAVTSAGIPLMTHQDLKAGNAISADFTAEGWREHLNLAGTPVLTPCEAGERIACLGDQYNLAFFEYWLSDYAGHNQDMQAAEKLLVTFDKVLGSAGAAQVQELHRQLFINSADEFRQEIEQITGVEVCEAIGEVATTRGAGAQVFTTGTMVQVFLLAQGVPEGSWGGNGSGDQS